MVAKGEKSILPFSANIILLVEWWPQNPMDDENVENCQTDKCAKNQMEDSGYGSTKR